MYKNFILPSISEHPKLISSEHINITTVVVMNDQKRSIQTVKAGINGQYM
jgi:hypothetical protein